MQRLLVDLVIFVKIDKNAKSTKQPLHGMEVFPPPNHGRRRPPEAADPPNPADPTARAARDTAFCCFAAESTKMAKMGRAGMGRPPTDPK